MPGHDIVCVMTEKDNNCTRDSFLRPHYTEGHLREQGERVSRDCVWQLLTLSACPDQSMFDNLSTKEFLNSRQRSNPYETIKGAFFQNRYIYTAFSPFPATGGCGL